MKQTGEGLYSFPHVLLFVVAWAVVQAAIALIHFPEVLAGGQIDSDGYFRLIRVEHLLTTGAWYDNVIAGSNWPFGEVIHWTRPLDALMIVLAAPFLLFMSVEGAVAVSGALVSALLHGALCVAGVWLVAPVVPGPARFLAMPALLAHPGVFAYGTLGRADHHVLVVLLAFLAVGAWLRSLRDPDARRPAVWTGILMGLALWVSPEALLPLAVVFVAGGIAWIAAGDRYRPPNLRLCGALALTVAAAVVIERPPSGWLAVEFDRISVGHLTMALIAGGFWVVAGAASKVTGRNGWHKRLALAGAGGAASLALLRVVHPGFFQGPAAQAHARMDEIFFPFVNELQPLLPTDLAAAGAAVSYLGAVLVALPYAVYRVGRAQEQGQRAMWVFLLAALVLLVPLAAGQRRLVGYAGVVLALVVTSLLADTIRWADRIRSPLRARLVRVGSMAGLLLGFLVVGSAMGAVAELADQDGVAASPAMPMQCSVPGLSRLLSDPAELGGEPRTIAASPSIGPELLYRTPHRILSGPYHRNHEGMAAIVDLFTSTDEEVARHIVATRDVGFLVLCPAFDHDYFTVLEEAPETGAAGDTGSLYRALLAGEPPEWLDEVPLSDAGPALAGFLVYEVR